MRRMLGWFITVIFVIGLIGFMPACGEKGESNEQAGTTESKAPAGEVDMEWQTKAETFLDKYQADLEKVYVAEATSYWNASNSGKKEDYDAYAAANLEQKKMHSNQEEFKKIQELTAHKDSLKPLTARSLQVAELAYKNNQLPPETLEKLSKMAADIEQVFNTFRGTYDGKEYSNNQLGDMLKVELVSTKRQKIWEALKQVGEAVAPKLIELAKIRNAAAVALGYKNYWDMAIQLQEHNPDELLSIFARLEEVTNEPFSKAKTKMDQELAAKFKIKPEEMMPWHYDNPFFQEPSPSDKVDVDEFYADKKKEDIIELTRKFYADIDLPIDDIIARSDLYEREGKQPHAFCTSIDRKGDVRAQMNIRPNAYWMDTALHEMGHGVYDKYINGSLPFILREPAHAFTTEAVAMLFGALAKTPLWITTYGGANEKRVQEVADAILEQRRREQLLFCRWSLVMLYFEKALYENPEQDLNTLWWDMAERLQMLKRPEGRNKADWASKIHFCMAPVYYHNYQMGELLAAQLRATLVKIAHHTGPAYTLNYSGNKAFGQFFKEKIFGPGQESPWPEFVKNATGEPLNPQYFADEVK